MNVLTYKGIHPDIGEEVFVAHNACVIGDVEIGRRSSVWFSCTVRGDVNEIRIGDHTNIQDNTVIHVATKGQGTYIGDYVTIGHGCIIHACTIGKLALIGMGSCILDGAKVEDNAMLAAGSLLTSGKTVPSGELWGGRPARFMRKLEAGDMAHMEWSAKHYVDVAKAYID